MPTLDWIGKAAVVNHHYDVPFHFLERKYGNSDENMIIHGDNLIALKSLMPRFEGRIKCIYIDPPYNTGNEGWVYNDNVSDPALEKWLGEVVGREGEDFTRHDKWLCMMYPRLRLMQRLMTEDGAIFISIDDNEQANLKLMCDEIFGAQNFIANISWEKRYTRSNNAKMFYSLKDSILCYRKSAALSVMKEPRTEKADANYSNPDDDPRGPWMTASYVNPATKDKRPNLVYPLTAPDGRLVNHPTHAWKYSESEHRRHVAEGRLWWGADGTAKFPRLKLYRAEMPGMVPVDLWGYKESGTTDEGSATLKSIFGRIVFDTPKPVRLLERILRVATDKDSIVFDAFAGSGTTAHAVINLNAADSGNRRFILIESQPYAETIAAERVRRVAPDCPFSFYEIGKPLFIDERLNPAVELRQIHEYVYFSETRQPLPTVERQYLLGIHDGVSYYYLHDRALDVDFLFSTLSDGAKERIIYAPKCLLGGKFLSKYRAEFKRIPSDILRL